MFFGVKTSKITFLTNKSSISIKYFLITLCLYSVPCVDIFWGKNWKATFWINMIGLLLGIAWDICPKRLIIIIGKVLILVQGSQGYWRSPHSRGKGRDHSQLFELNWSKHLMSQCFLEWLSQCRQTPKSSSLARWGSGSTGKPGLWRSPRG